MASYDKDRQNITARLKRIEGQVRGIQRMIDEDKYCVDILTQLSSIVAATQKVGLIVLENHIHGCVTDAVKTESTEEGEIAVQELIEVIERFVKR